MFEWLVEYINECLKTTSQPVSGQIFIEHEELFNMTKDELEQFGRSELNTELDKRLKKDTLIAILLELLDEKSDKES
jgi:hypothetical protein